MTSEDIIRMAREAGFEAYRGRGLLDHVPEDVFAATVNITEEIERFADLVRADERNAVEERVVDLFTDMEMPYLPDIVNAIRARGSNAP